MAVIKKFQSTPTAQIEQPRNSKTKTNNLFQVGRTTTNTMNRPRENTNTQKTSQTKQNTSNNTTTLNIEQPRNSATKTNNLFQVGRTTTNTINRPRETSTIPQVTQTSSNTSNEPSNSSNSTTNNVPTFNIEQPRNNSTKTNDLFQIGRTTTNTMNRPREEQTINNNISQDNYSNQKSTLNNGGDITTLGKKVQNLVSRFKNMNSSDGIDYKAKYEELINNPDLICKPDGTPLPIEQQPPIVKQQYERIEKSIENVTNPQPTIKQPTVEEQPIEAPIEQQVQEEVQEEGRENPEMILGENKEGLIYGRASGEAQQTINTNANEYNPEIAINQERQVSYQNLQGMSSYNIAVSMANGYTPFGDQAMRDLQQYDPQKYQEIQDELKKIQVGEQINQISTGGKIDITSQTQATTNTINNSIDEWAKKNSDSQSYDSTLNSLTSKLASSQTAQSVTQEMMNINKDIAEIQEQMNNLPKEAQKAFKGDVPQYLVDAYISNKAQELTTKLNTLQSRYTGLSDMYKAELSQKQFETEMELKRQQMDMNERQFQWNVYLQQQKFLADQDQQLRERDYNTAKLNYSQDQQLRERDYNMKKLNYSNIQNIGGEAYVRDANGQRSKLSDDVAYQSYQTKVNNTLQNYMNLYPDGTKYGQCEKFTNDIVQAITGLRMKTKTNFGGTTAQEKANYVNDREPRVGSVAVFDYGIVQDNGVNYGHTAIVTGYDPNTGIVSLTDANYNSDGVVHTRQIPLSQLNNASFKGFWNPYLDKQSESIKQQQPSGSYTYAQTPMTKAFQEAQDEASDADTRKAIGNAFEGYKKLNDLVNKGAIDVICNSSDFDTLIQRVNDNKFLDEQGNIDWSAMGEYARNSLKNEDLSLGIDALRRMIEIKLRRESGAAISMTEWKDQFSRYLPQLGQSPEEKRRRLIELERDGVVSLLPIKYQTNYIPLISEVSTLPNEIWDD